MSVDILDRTRLARAAELLADVARTPRHTFTRKTPPVTLDSALSQMAGIGHLMPGSPEADFFAEQAALARSDIRPMLSERELFIPFSMLSGRAMEASLGSIGGYLVGTETSEAIDILRPWSVMARAGITIEAGLKGNLVLPRTTAKSTPYWIGENSSTAQASDPTVGEASLTPRGVAALIAFSQQLLMQSRAEIAIKRELLRTIGTAIDQAVLAGTGGVQPLGILNTPGIGTESGTSLAQAGVVSMKRKVSDANADDDGIAFLATPAVRELLEKRERATGLGFIWDNDRVASRPAYASTDMPAGTMLCSHWPSIYIGIWGNGFIIEVDPSTAFNSGGLVARILIYVDVVLIHPSAVCVATSIT